MSAPLLSRRLAWVPALLLAAAFIPLAPWIWSRWQQPDGFFSHGPLVPFAAAWLAFARRKSLAEAAAEARGDWRGLLLALPATALLLAATFVRVDSPTVVALLLLAAGLAWLLFGARFLRRLAVPLGFLLFAVPWPMELLADTVQSLKQVVLTASGALLGWAGTGIHAAGSFLVLPGGERLLVDDECSGLSSAIALAALGAFMAGSATTLSPARRVVLLALALPVALLSNLVRVLSLAWIGLAHGAAKVGDWHDVTNALVYALAIGGFVLAEQLLRRRGPRGAAP